MPIITKDQLANRIKLAKIAIDKINSEMARLRLKSWAPGMKYKEISDFQLSDSTPARTGSLKVDGIYGPNTKTAITWYLQKFQPAPVIPQVNQQISTIRDQPITWKPPQLVKKKKPAPKPAPKPAEPTYTLVSSTVSEPTIKQPTTLGLQATKSQIDPAAAAPTTPTSSKVVSTTSTTSTTPKSATSVPTSTTSTVTTKPEQPIDVPPAPKKKKIIKPPPVVTPAEPKDLPPADPISPPPSQPKISAPSKIKLPASKKPAESKEYFLLAMAGIGAFLYIFS